MYVVLKLIEIKCICLHNRLNAIFACSGFLVFYYWSVVFYPFSATRHREDTQIFFFYIIRLICLKIFFCPYITLQINVQYSSVMNVLQMFYRHLNGQRRTWASWQEVWLSSQGGLPVDGKRLLTNWVDQWQMWVHSDLHCVEDDKPEQDRQCRRQTYMGADIVFWEKLQSF